MQQKISSGVSVVYSEHGEINNSTARILQSKRKFLYCIDVQLDVKNLIKKFAALFGNQTEMRLREYAFLQGDDT